MTETLKDLVMRADREEVRRVIDDNWGDALSPLSRDAHMQVLTQLQVLKPQKPLTFEGAPLVAIQLCRMEDEWDGKVEVFTDVCGLDAKDDRWAIEFQPWSQWLSLPIRTVGQEYTEAQIIAHCLYEMTFLGYDEEIIKEQSDKLKESAEQLDKDIASGDMSNYVELKPH
jgi:hypothetical protein